MHPASELRAYCLVPAGKGGKDVLEQTVHQLRLILAESGDAHPIESTARGSGDLRRWPRIRGRKPSIQERISPDAHPTDPLGKAADRQRDHVIEEVFRTLVEEGIASFQRGSVEHVAGSGSVFTQGRRHWRASLTVIRSRPIGRLGPGGRTDLFSHSPPAADANPLATAGRTFSASSIWSWLRFRLRSSRPHCRRIPSALSRRGFASPGRLLFPALFVLLAG